MGKDRAVLGLARDPWHDTGAAVVVGRHGGLDVAAISQQRLDRRESCSDAPWECVLEDRLRPFVEQVLATLPDRWAVFGGGEVGRVITRLARRLGRAPSVIVESSPAADRERRVDGLEVSSPAQALAKGVTSFVLGTFASGGAMSAVLHDLSAHTGQALDIRTPPVPLELRQGAGADSGWSRARACVARSRTLAEYLWLDANKVERMDASVPVNAAERRRLHLDRYRFAACFAPGARVLDCACGTGYGSAVLAAEGRAADVVGVDLDPVTIAYARRHHAASAVRFEAVDAAALTGLGSETIDLIASFETIEHVADDRAVLQAWCRVLRSGGRVVVSTPNDWPIDSSPFHVRSYDVVSFVALLSEFFHEVQLLGQWAPTGRQPGRIAPMSPADADPAECLVAVCGGAK